VLFDASDSKLQMSSEAIDRVIAMYLLSMTVGRP